MVVVELFLGLEKVCLNVLARTPWQGQEPVQIVPHDGRFRRHRRHLPQLLHLGVGLGTGLFR